MFCASQKISFKFSGIIIKYIFGIQTSMEKYSRGWRGAPAKGVGRLRGARVQIPLSPFLFLTLILKNKNNEKKEKNCWQKLNSVLNYQSCRWKTEFKTNFLNDVSVAQQFKPKVIWEKAWTLKTKQYQPSLKNSKFFKDVRHRNNCGRCRKTVSKKQ